MIDWVAAALNALWIAGIALILAAFGYHHWLAGETARRLREVLAQPSWKLPFSTGMLLTCLGFACGLAGRWWEKGLWTALAVSYARQLVTAVRQRQKARWHGK